MPLTFPPSIPREELADATDTLKGAALVGVITDDGAPANAAEMVGAYINVLSTGSLNDATAELQNYVNSKTAPRLKRAVYRVTAPIVLESGARLSGGGWTVRDNDVDDLLSGNSSTLLVDHDGPIFTWDGDKDTGDYADNFHFEGFAIYSPEVGTDNRGFDLDAFRSATFKNLYLYRLLAGIRGRGQSWQSEFARVWTNACTRGFDAEAGIEDSTFLACVSRFGDIGFRQNFAGQTNNLIGCDLSRNRIGLLLNSGGTYNGHVNVQGCQFEMEDGADAAIYVESASTLMPSLTVANSRFLSLETTPAKPCIYIKDKGHLVTTRNTVRNCYDFIEVAAGAVASTEVVMIEDELTLNGGFEVRGDDGTFVTKIKAGAIKVPTGSSKGVQIGSSAKFRVTDAGGFELVLSDATIARAADGEVSVISAASKAVRMKPGGTQTVVFGATGTTISTAKVNLSALPTSTAGLSAGDLWRDTGDGNTVKCIP